MNRLAVAIAVLPCLTEAQYMPDGPGRETMEQVCGQCHEPSFVLGRGRGTRSDWSSLVDEMISQGGSANEKQVQIIKDYLTKTFGKVNVNKAASAEIADILEIAPSQADAIVAYKTEHGVFKNIGDLKKVPGIDSANLDSKKDRVTY